MGHYSTLQPLFLKIKYVHKHHPQYFSFSYLVKKKAKHILNSGLPLDIAVKSIGTEMATQKINLDLPKDMFNPALAIENK